MIRVTADSNIYISAFQFKGLPLELLTLAASGNLRLAVSEDIIQEVTRTLRRKFDWPDERIVRAERNMRRIAQLVTPTMTVDAIREDPADNRILECALAAGSEFIVTGDKDLLRRKGYEGIKIVTVGEFLDRSK